MTWLESYAITNISQRQNITVPGIGEEKQHAVLNHIWAFHIFGLFTTKFLLGLLTFLVPVTIISVEDRGSIAATRAEKKNGFEIRICIGSENTNLIQYIKYPNASCYPIDSNPKNKSKISQKGPKIFGKHESKFQ